MTTQLQSHFLNDTEIFYVTGNNSKFEEVKKFLEKNNNNLKLSQANIDLEEIQSLDMRKVSLDKAEKAYNRLRKPVIVDDAGIYFTKYNNFPGTLSKFIHAAIGMEGIFKLTEPGDEAHFLSYMILMYAPGKYEIFEGKCEGYIVHQKCDCETKCESQSLPFDHVFAVSGINKTYHDLRKMNQLDDHNYRIRALKKLLKWLTGF